MLVFASGVFRGWKHETFGQCFLDSVWLIQEELPQSNVSGGWVQPRVTRRRRQFVERRVAVSMSAAGRSAAAISVTRVIVRAGRASGGATTSLRAAIERAVRAAAAGRTTSRATIRSERLPVFSDDEMVALAAWVCLQG